MHLHARVIQLRSTRMSVEGKKNKNEAHERLREALYFLFLPATAIGYRARPGSLSFPLLAAAAERTNEANLSGRLAANLAAAAFLAFIFLTTNN